LQLLVDTGILTTSTPQFWLKDPLVGRPAAPAATPRTRLPEIELVLPNQVLEPSP
jgi:hypothetical protein